MLREGLSIHGHHANRRPGPNARAIRLLLQQRCLAREVSRTQHRKGLFVRANTLVPQDLNFSLLNREEGVRVFSLAVEKVAWPVKSPRKSLIGVCRKGSQIAREHHVPNPIGAYAKAPRPTRQFHQIHAPPHEPRQNSGNAHSKHLRYRAMPANRAELTERLEMERL